MKKRMRIIYVALLVCICFSGCKESNVDTDNKTTATETIGSEPIRETPKASREETQDGERYSILEYKKYTVKYPVFEKTIISEEKIADFGRKGATTANLGLKIDDGNGGIARTSIYVRNLLLPNVFDSQSVSSIKYKLYNCQGKLSTKEIAEVQETIESTEIEVSGDMLDNIYVNFHSSYEINAPVDDNKELFENSVIKAQVSYLDGSEETVYLGVRQVDISKYGNPEHFEIYRLTVED